MKKCGSCTKDLPDAALHCVFCGAKQAPVAAVQSSVAKTAFGYSAADLPESVRRPQGAPQQPMGNAPSQPNYMPPGVPQQMGNAPSQPNYAPPGMAPQGPRPHSPSQPNYPMGPQGGNMAQAATMFAPPQGGPQPGPGPGPGPGYGQPPPGYPQGPGPGYGPPGGPPGGPYGAPAPGYPQGPGPGGPGPGYGQPPPGPGYGAPPPQYQQPPQQNYQQPPPYLASQTAAHAGRPVEPWREALRLMMFVWGVVLIAAFVTPIAGSPKMAFHWNTIADAAGKAKVPPLLLVSIGVLSMAVGGMPLAAMPRGILAAVLGLAGVFVPFLIAAFPGWRVMLPLVGTLVLVPGLLVRNEYRESIVPRVLVTVGVLCYLLPLLIPQGGQIPLVNDFKQLIDAPGKAKLPPLVDLALLVVVVLSLLAWMPAPATGGAKVFAWILILAGVVHHLAKLVTASHLGAHIKATPYEALMEWAPVTAYAVLIGYGLATVFGKQLE